MAREKDDVKLMRIVREYSKARPIFTSEMVFNYLFNRKIKFLKEMNKTRIGMIISRSNEFDVVRKRNVNYFVVID